MRPIDADALKAKECADCQFRTEECPADCGVMERIDSLPTIEAEPVKHGKWITHNIENPMFMYGECSECHREVNCKSNYCPNCGAKMDGADESTCSL